jgi:hypothetical protein
MAVSGVPAHDDAPYEPRERVEEVLAVIGRGAARSCSPPARGATTIASRDSERSVDGDGHYFDALASAMAAGLLSAQG